MDADQLIFEEFENSQAKKLGVKLPDKNTQKYETLKYYWENKQKIVNKAEATSAVSKRLNISVIDLQALRHLAKQDGFDILQGPCEYNGIPLKKGQYVFLGFDTVNQYWHFSRRKEDDLDFQKVIKKYNNSCATCGAKEKKEHRYTNQIVLLEKGHKNPNLPMTNDNIIPQCSYCNKRASNKFIFDDYGFVKYPTKEGLQSFPKEVKEEFFNILKQELG